MHRGKLQQRSKNAAEDMAHICDSRCQNHVYNSGHSEPVTVSQRIAAVYKAKKFTDLIIHFPKTEEKFEVHRLILAMSSSVFESMLYGSSAVGPTLHMSEDSPEGFRWLLDYIYCDITHFNSIGMALKVSHLACKYEISSLKQLCSEFMHNILKDDNYLEIYNAAIELDSSDLLRRCSKMIQESEEYVFSSEKVTQLSCHAFRYLLQMPRIRISEAVVFRALIAWGRKHLAARMETITPADLRQEVEEFLPHIHFLQCMSTDEFVENVIPTEIFTPEESCTILKTICGMQTSPLPSCCSTCQIEEKKHTGQLQ